MRRVLRDGGERVVRRLVQQVGVPAAAAGRPSDDDDDDRAGGGTTSFSYSSRRAT